MRTIFILLLSLFATTVSAQTLSGTLAARNNHAPVPYAAISLIDSAGKSVSSSITDEMGKFFLKVDTMGSFTLKCGYIGYQILTQRITLGDGKTDVGTLLLTPDEQLISEVTISGQQPALRLQLDKKVFEVGKDVLSKNGSLGDALNGTPSVTVGPQGEVSLRGNPSVTVLVNGRRSGLTQGNALEQLQADQVEHIEVITSPSARYDAAGNAGIINIVLKKNKKGGFNGQLNVLAGIPTDTRINPSLNYKSDKVNFFSTFGMRKTDYDGIYTTDQTTGSTTLQVRQDERRHDDGKLLYLGADYYLSEKSTMTAAYLWKGTHDHDKTELNYDYRSTLPDSMLRRKGESWEQRNYHQLEYNYTQLFTRAKQKWTVDMQYDWWDSNKDWTLGTHKSLPTVIDYATIRTNTHDTNRDLLVQSDWVQPIGEETLLEFGVKSENRHVQYDFLAEQQAGSAYVVYKGLDNGLNYSENIQGGYGQLSSKLGKFSYLGGVRLEITGVNISGRSNLNMNRKNYTKLFPTLHLEYAFNAASAMQLHYSRRINRPSLNELSPFMEITDLNSQYIGNSDLNPAYSDVYELGYLYRNNTLTLNPSLYMQQTGAPIEDYTFRNADGTFTTFPVNIGRETRHGIELNMTYRPLKALQLNADFNIYHLRQSGIYRGFDFGYSGGSSSGRISAQWKIGNSFSAQGRYNFIGPSATSQSRTLAVHSADFGISKNLLSDRLSIVADVTNAFDTQRYRTTTTGTGYEFSTMNRRNGARYRLSMVYKFKNNAVAREAKSGNRN